MKYFYFMVVAALAGSALGQSPRLKVKSTGAPGIVARGGSAAVEDHPLRITAIDILVNGSMGGADGARILCNEMAYHARQKQFRNGNWRPVITTRTRSLWSLPMYQHERTNSPINNLRNETLWSSWNDFVNGVASDAVRDSGKTQIETFDGTDLMDVFAASNQAEKYAWFGYTPDSEFSDTRTINATSSSCGNWRLLSGEGPALNLEVFMNTGSIGGDAVEMKPCSSSFALLCVERTADWEGGYTFSMYGKDVGYKRGRAVHPRAKAYKKQRHVTQPVIDKRRKNN